jgi:LysM repeat protein
MTVVQTRVGVLLLLVLVLSACNLSRRTPTPLPQPTATFAAPLVAPTQDPLNPLAATALPAVVNPNCAQTPPTWVVYTVEPGDSLGLLAEQTGTGMSDIIAGNCLDNPDQIEVGQVLYLPTTPVVAP